jgi:hypothetical protein
MFVRELRSCRGADLCGVDTDRCLSCRRCVLSNDDDETREDGPPPPPTNARPGTEEKLRVLQWRVEHEFGLWNPEDAIQ